MRYYIKFLSIGLVHALIVEAVFLPQNFISELDGTVLIHTLFISLAFALNKALFSRISSIFKEYFAFYVTFGLIGLICIEWLVVGNFTVNENMLVNIITQVFMFSFWAVLVSVPKLVLDVRFSWDYKKRLFRRILYLLVIFIPLGAVLYSIMQNFEAWQAGIVLFYLSLNFVFGKHFLYARSQD